MLKKPTAQTAHLVSADTQPNAKKPKELFFANARLNKICNFVHYQMTRFYYITFIILTGFLLKPVQTYACGTESHKTETSCNNQSGPEVDNKETCNKETEHCGKHGKDCDGKCGNPNCHCPTNSINVTVPLFAQLSQVKVIITKPNFYYQETHYSSGFLSIWLPPKIS